MKKQSNPSPSENIKKPSPPPGPPLKKSYCGVVIMKMEENKSKPLTVGKSAILLNAETVRNAIDSESEVPGPMPNELWDLIRNNKTSAEQTIREVLRQTKEGIKSRLGV